MQGNYRENLGEAFVKMGEEFKDLVVVTADVSKSTKSIKFKEKYPERFFSVGIAEANAVGIAAGLATFGIPVIFTAYAVFAAEKPFEQIRNMIAYPNMNVKIVATHGGVNVGQDGATHQAIEDIAIMRAIPNMTVVSVADPGEVTSALRAILSIKGPAYLRLARNNSEIIHENEDQIDFRIGKAEVLRNGSDVTIMAIGMMVYEAIIAADKLAKENIHTRVVNIRTIKPIDRDTIDEAAKETGAIVVAEDHNCFGGLTGAIAEVLVSNTPVPMESVSLNDTFGRSGEAFQILKKYKLTADEIYKKAKIAISRKQNS